MDGRLMANRVMTLFGRINTMSLRLGRTCRKMSVGLSSLGVSEAIIYLVPIDRGCLYDFARGV